MAESRNLETKMDQQRMKHISPILAERDAKHTYVITTLRKENMEIIFICLGHQV
jgi:hypothetical protein